MTDVPEAVELRTTRANDWTWTVVGAVIFVAAAYSLATSTAVDWQTLEGIRGEWIYALLLRLIGVDGVRILLGGLAMVFGLNALGAAWRLLDGRVALRAESFGLTLHPSFCGKPLSWSDIDSIKLAGRRPARIIVRLKQRFWSVTHPLTGRDVQLNIVAIGTSYRSAENAVRRMRQWLKE